MEQLAGDITFALHVRFPHHCLSFFLWFWTSCGHAFDCMLKCAIRYLLTNVCHIRTIWLESSQTTWLMCGCIECVGIRAGAEQCGRSSVFQQEDNMCGSSHTSATHRLLAFNFSWYSRRPCETRYDSEWVAVVVAGMVISVVMIGWSDAKGVIIVSQIMRVRIL